MGLVGFGMDVPFQDAYGTQGVADMTGRPPSCGSYKGLQQMLADLGFYDGNIDGDFGPGSEKAVTDFRSSAGLPHGGMNRSTCEAIMAAWSAKTAGGAAPGGAAGGGAGMPYVQARSFAALRRPAVPGDVAAPAEPAPAANGGLLGTFKRQPMAVKIGAGVLLLAVVGGAAYYFYTT